MRVTAVETSKILSPRDDVVAALMAMLTALDKQFPAGRSGFPLGQTCAHYSVEIANMEGLSRALWGVFPLLAGGEEVPCFDKYCEAIRQGTDPDRSSSTAQDRSMSQC